MVKKEYIFSADVIRVVAIVGVVIIHTVNAIHARPDFVGGGTWWLANLLESASRMSVPLFVMLSGYFILGKDEKPSSTLSRIWWRIGIPYLFWLGVYLYWSGGLEASNYLSLLLSGGAFHLYFLVILIGLYFVAPLLRKFFVSSSFMSQLTVMAVFFTVGIGMVGLEYFYSFCDIENSFVRWIPFAGYFCGGYVLGKKRLLPVALLLGAFLLGLGVAMYFNYYHLLLVREGVGSMQPSGCISPYFDNFLSPSVVLMSLSSFALLFHTNFEWLKMSKKASTLIKSVAGAAFGIYLVHILLIEIFDVRLNLTIDTYAYPLLSFFVVRFVVVFVLSYLLAVVLRKIPLLKMVVGER